MTLCEGEYKTAHEQICFEGRGCPLCEAKEEAEITNEEEMTKLYKQIEAIQKELEKSNTELANCKVNFDR